MSNHGRRQRRALNSLPLLWTADFILASPPGAAAEKWVVSEFNCSCVGLSRCLAACCTDAAPTASWNDVSEDDQREALRLGDRLAAVALDILRRGRA